MISQTREKKKEAPSLPPRERLLKSAARLFYKEGVQAVGIERLLEDADTAKASLYSNFGSKDALVAAYLEREAATIKTKLQTRLDSVKGTPRDKILKMFDMLTEQCREDGYRGCPFQNAASELTDAGHPGRAVVLSQRGWLLNMIRGLVTDAGLPAEPVSQALVALYEGAVAGALVDDSGAGQKAARWAAERLLGETTRPPSSKG